MAPSTSGLGARSAPMASTAMMVGMTDERRVTDFYARDGMSSPQRHGGHRGTLASELRDLSASVVKFSERSVRVLRKPGALTAGLFDLDDFAALIVATLRAGAMRQF